MPRGRVKKGMKTVKGWAGKQINVKGNLPGHRLCQLQWNKPRAVSVLFANKQKRVRKTVFAPLGGTPPTAAPGAPANGHHHGSEGVSHT